MKIINTKTIKTINILSITFVFALLTSCGGGSDSPVDPVPVNTVYSGEINEDITWTKDNIYTLDGRVMVTNGVTLTIEAGTVIKGSAGTGEDASCLIIARGGKIMANGTSVTI